MSTDDNSSLDALTGRIIRIETKLDLFIEAINRRMASDDDSRKDHEARLRTLEKRDGYVMGICAVIAFAAPYILKKLGI